MVIHNKTVLSGEEVYNSLIASSRKNYFSKFAFSFALVLVGAAIAFISFFINQSDSMTIGFLFLGVGVLYTLMTLISYFRLPAKLQKNNSEVIANGMINNFTFKEESFQLHSLIGTHTAKFDFKYEELYKIIEYDETIVFMLSKSDLFICKKECFASLKEMSVFFYGLSKHKIKIKQKLSKPSAKN